MTRFGDVRSDTATTLAGSVSASDGLSSIEMTSSTSGPEQHPDATTIRHFAVADAAVHGLLEFTATAATMRVGTATLIVDRGTPGELAIAGLARRFYAPAFTFTFTGLTSCAPGLDRP